MSDASGPRPVPVTDDPDTAGFFEAARRGQLALRFCPRCNLVVHFPRAYCDRCPGSATEWRAVRPAATLYSFTRCTWCSTVVHEYTRPRPATGCQWPAHDPHVWQ